MNKIEVRDKLRNIIGEMLVTDLESGRVVPDCVCDYILEKHGWTTTARSGNTDDLEDFVKILRKWVEDWHLLQDHAKPKIVEIDCDLHGIHKKYAEAESEYWQVISELVKVLQEAIHEKENYSEHFKMKCKSQETRMNVLVAKSQFLKLQFYLKLYGEENSLAGHLALESRLRKKLEFSKKSYKELVEVNKQYDEIKNDENFCKLFKAYKELKKIEKRTEIIGNM